MKMRILLVCMLFALFLTSCAGAQVEPTPYPSEVDWETAIEILNSGDVEMVAQLHSLDVYLTLTDGTEIHTVEPSIDAIFQEVEQCGQPCREIVLATE
jgi:PBP1b-binding outer membrane lipoprotein LpoB